MTYNRATPGVETTTINSGGNGFEPNTAVILWNVNNNALFLPSGNTATFQGAPGNGNYRVLNRLNSADPSSITLDGNIVGRISAANTAAGGTISFTAVQGNPIVVGPNANFDVNRLRFRENNPNTIQNVTWNGTFTTGATGGALILLNTDFAADGGSIIKQPAVTGTFLDLQNSNFQLGNTNFGLDAVLMTDSTFGYAAGATNSSGSLAQAFTLSGAGFNTIRVADQRTLTLAGPIDGTGMLSIDGTGTTILTGTNTYTGGTTIVAGSFLQIGNGGTSGSIVGNVLNDGTLAFNRSNALQFDGVISGSGGLQKAGTGALILTANNAYIGPTDVNGGTLVVDGSIATSTLTTVNAGGTLAGSGTVGTTSVAGGSLAPGSAGGSAFGPLNVTGSLTFSAASTYMIQVSPATAGTTIVTGAAGLGGATVNAMFQPGTYVARQYTILTANGGLGGTTFNPTVVSSTPGIAATLSYNPTNVFLNIDITFATPGGLTGNQQNVANTLTNFFNSTGGIPFAFATLSPAGLTQISGETATGSQQTTFNAMNQFMGVMTDPFLTGRGDPVSAGGNPTAYSEEGMAYAARRKPSDALAAIYRKAPPVAPGFEQRWSVWAAGFGGSQRTDGNAIVGSNDTRSSLAAVAAGADYRISPDTLVGFALAGGGTSFSVNGFGSGRSDLFQAGAFFRHNAGPAYLTGALAYGWQDVTTDRTVTVAGIDRLRATFNANALSGRLEGGYRVVRQGIGITPYAAAQFTTFELPNYAEQAVVGANTFALAYAGRNVTASRSEFGLRTDKSFAMQDAILTLRGRAAWAHDFNTDRSLLATFQTLPGASFVVNGAAQAREAALVTAAAEVKWVNGWSAAATFEGEFSDLTRSYAGKGVVRYAW